MTARGKPIAGNALNTITLTPFALNVLDVTPLVLEQPTSPFGATLVPVREAYVIVRQQGAPDWTPLDGPLHKLPAMELTHEEARVALTVF